MAQVEMPGEGEGGGPPGVRGGRGGWTTRGGGRP